jgi:hypothetical protein
LGTIAIPAVLRFCFLVPHERAPAGAMYLWYREKGKLG